MNINTAAVNLEVPSFDKNMLGNISKDNNARFSVYVDKWIKIGHSTEPCDMEKAAEYAAQLYRAAGKEPPQYYLGPFNHPIEGAIAESLLIKWADEGRSFGEEGVPTDNDRDILNKTLMDEVAAVIASGGTHLNNTTTNNQLYGYQNFELVLHEFMHEELNSELTAGTAALIGIAQVCGWWTPLTGVAIFQHRPLEVHVDAQNRYHNLNGPAIKFRGPSDICDVYSINGIRFSKKDFLSIPSKAT